MKIIDIENKLIMSYVLRSFPLFMIIHFFVLGIGDSFLVMTSISPKIAYLAVEIGAVLITALTIMAVATHQQKGLPSKNSTFLMSIYMTLLLAAITIITTWKKAEIFLSQNGIIGFIIINAIFIFIIIVTVFILFFIARHIVYMWYKKQEIEAANH